MEPESKFSDTGPNDAEATNALEVAKIQKERLLLAWNDQVGQAQTLNEKRKTILTIGAALAGLGLFRIDLFRGATDKVMASGWSLGVILGCSTLALICFGVAIFLTMTERPIVVPVARILRRGTPGAFKALFFHRSISEAALFYRSVSIEVAESCRDDTTFRRASWALWVNPEELENSVDGTPVETMLAYCAALQTASADLDNRNRRVKERLGRAGRWIMWSGGFVFAAVVTFFWSIL